MSHIINYINIYPRAVERLLLLRDVYVFRFRLQPRTFIFPLFVCGNANEYASPMSLV